MKNKKMMIGFMSLILTMVALFCVYKITAPKAHEGQKEITVTVVHADGTSKNFNYTTDEEYLGSLIEKESLVEGERGTYGLFIKSVDGEMADESKEQWWCITKSGGQVNTSADLTPISDGDVFELTLIEGYGF